MGEDPSSSNTHSHKRRISLTTLSPSSSSSSFEEQHSTLNPLLNTSLEPEISPEQSPKKPKLEGPHGYFDVMSGVSSGFSMANDIGTESMVVGVVDSEGFDGVFGMGADVAGEKNETLVGPDQVGMLISETGQLGSLVADEISGQENNEGGFDVISQVEQLGADVAYGLAGKEETLVGSVDVDMHIPGIEQVGFDGQNMNEGFKGFDETSENVAGIKQVGPEVADGVSFRMMGSDDVCEEKIVSFETNDEINEFLELKDEVGLMGNRTSSEIVHFGSAEGPPSVTSEVRTFESKSTCGVMLERLDDSEGGEQRDGRSGDKTDGGVGISDGGEGKMMYSRKEMERLRYVNFKGQKKFWQEVLNGFDEDVKQEYMELSGVKHHKQKGSAAGKRDYHGQGTLGETASDNMSGNWNEAEEDSDNEYRSIQRPAFAVEGEPDFESGPPEDGLEYLRRVRWEAKQIPKVKVAKLDKSKLKEQSVYMPMIPDIDECPPHLVPLRQWEDEFIAEFSELRLALSALIDSGDTASEESETTIVFSRPECSKRTSKNVASLELPAGGPTLPAVQAMDPVTRVAMLNKRISLFQSACNLSKDDYAWLFALCAIVETPLDADTCASLRCLLRRCAKLRAEKSELDDEVIMLNILATIAGKFFRQSEN